MKDYIITIFFYCICNRNLPAVDSGQNNTTSTSSPTPTFKNNICIYLIYYSALEQEVNNIMLLFKKCKFVKIKQYT